MSETTLTTQQRTFDETHEHVATIKGWMTPSQARRLWDAATALDSGGRIVEIGSYQGRSTVLLGNAIKPGVELIAIDPHGSSIRTHEVADGREDEADAMSKAFLAELERGGVADRVTYIRKSSHAALWDVEGQVDVLYIDGSHNFGPAKADMVEWGARVAKGGTMLIHDSYTSVGVTLAIMACLWPSKTFRYVGRSGSLTEFRREDITGAQRRKNIAMQLGQLPNFARNLLVEVLLLARLRPLTKFLGYDTKLDWPH